jgi:hypothetical protein
MSLTPTLGFAHARTTVANHMLRLDAQSVVIHDPVTKAKIVCADLD